MKFFLKEHDLWNVVETTTEPTTPAWSKKNALALYLIRESCGSNRFSLIEKISKAKNAWDKIADSGSYFSPKDTYALSFYNNSLKFSNR